MTDRTTLAEPVPVQDVETGYWFVPSHDREEAWYVDDPDVLELRETYMRPVPPPPKDERDEWGFGDLPIRRDERGRFKRVWWWEECSKDHPDAHPYLEVRYPPT